VRSEQLDDESDAHAQLRDRRPGRRAGDSPAEAVHEQKLENEVGEVRHDDDLERAAEVRDAAQVPLAGERDERGGQPDRPDSKIGERVLAGLTVASKRLEQRRSDDLADDEHAGADRERSPEGLSGEPRGLLLLAGARRPRHDRRRAVREEVEDRERAREDGAGEAERSDLRPAEVADDRGVCEYVQRLRCERAERR
jgi:hypothetical protein